jgi:site-specific DNA recombinase
MFLTNGTDKKGIRLQCSAFRQSGTCDDGRRVYLDVIEAKALDGLRHHLAHPGLINEFVDACNAERKRLKKEANQDRGRIERRLGGIEREIKRAVNAITEEGVPAGPLAPRMRELETERTSLADRLDAAKEANDVIARHPKALDRYKDSVMRLAKNLERRRARRATDDPRTRDGRHRVRQPSPTGQHRSQCERGR